MHPSRSLCRLCAKPFESSSLLHIFHDQKSMTASLDALLKRYLPFPVSTNDNLTLYACKLCCAHVIQWHRFLTLCIKAQDHLRSMQDKLTGALNNSSPSKPSGVTFEDSRVIKQSKSDNASKKKKSNYCIARWCNNSNDIGIPFFRVPKDRKRAFQWLLAADRMDLADKDVAYLYRCYVCATHFAKEMFVNENCKSLNRNATPSIFPTPRYAQKIEKTLCSTEIYPKHLQGIRLKNILPKSAPKSQEISTDGCSLSPQDSRNYTPIVRLLHGPHQDEQDPMQEVLFIRDSVPCHSNIEIINILPVAGDPSEAVQVRVLEQEVPLTKCVDQPEILTTLTNEQVNGSISSTIQVFESSEKEFLTDVANTFICDNLPTEPTCQKTNRISLVDESNCTVIVSAARADGSLLPNGEIGFRSDEPYNDNDTVMLELEQKDVKTEAGALSVIEMKNVCEEGRITNESLPLHGMPSDDSLTSNVAVGASYSSTNTTSLLQENLSFCSKESRNKDMISNCLSNIVGSQDFLLMHSSNDHIDQARDHEFRQDKNLNNLCCTVVRESAASETSSVYGERSIMAIGSVRAIECTSPNHGQIIEGLVNLDQFLDSG